MPNIVPFTLRRLRNSKHLSLEQLSERARIDKGTIWRLEQGNDTNARESTIQKLARALNVEPAVLTGKAVVPEVDDDSKYFLMAKLNFRLSYSTHNALYLISERYGVTHQEVLELAPFLFCCAAEASLRQRRDRLQQAERACESARNLEREMQHLPDPDFTASEEKFAAESESINNQDLFGLQIEDANIRNDGTDNPFAIFLDGLAKNTGGNATFDSYGFRDFPEYRICPEQAAGIAHDDTELAEAILRGLVLLNDMPKEIPRGKQRVEWLRGKVEEFRKEMQRSLEQTKANEASP